MNTNNPKNPILTIKNVSKSFSTPQGVISILEDVTFTIYAGEKVAIVGPSGSGKSTLLSLVGLLDRPTAGSIEIEGMPVKDLSDNELAKLRNERIGFIFQAFELIAPFTVSENISAPLDIANKPVNMDFINKLIIELGLEGRREALPFTLSGGEKQRVAIARALANQPNLILADEPTGSLDRITGEKVLDLLLEAVDVQGKTLVVITHDTTIAEKMDRVLRISGGQIHEEI
jgi:putative ABC transport system ATP-binding protein